MHFMKQKTLEHFGDVRFLTDFKNLQSASHHLDVLGAIITCSTVKAFPLFSEAKLVASYPTKLKWKARRLAENS
jgi:hypothetical protein